MRVLLATDGSGCSDAATSAVAARPWPAGTEVRVVSVVEIPVSIAPESWILPPGYYEEIETAISKRAQEAVEDAARRLEAAHGDRVLVTKSVVTGAPKSAIVELANEWDADLIVVGSHGYSGFERFLLGSVSLAVAQHAKCSVEIARQRRRP